MAALVMPRRSLLATSLAILLCATAALAAPLAATATAAPATVTAASAAGGATTSSFGAGSPTGPDVSNWQHTNDVAINWQAVRDAGHQFAFVKASQGVDSVNPWFRRDFDGAAAVGLYRGAYAFAQPQLPVSTAADQARAYAATVRSLRGPLDLPPVLDLEVTGGLAPTDLIAWTRTWLTTTEQLTGRRPMIYSGPSFWGSALAGTTAFKTYYLWQAQWTPPLSPMGAWPSATFWQYTSTGSVPGIGGNVDISRFNGSRTQLTQLAGTTTGPDIAADGTFIVSAQKHAVYRMAGGAPIYVSTWEPFPNQEPIQVDQSYIDSLPTTPADGTILVGAQRGEVYIVAGGAPIYTSTVAPIPSNKTWTWVDSKAIDQAGGRGVWSHLRAVPADGTIVVGQQRGAIYIVAGGAPIYTSSMAPIGTKSWTVIDANAIDRAGQARPVEPPGQAAGGRHGAGGSAAGRGVHRRRRRADLHLHHRPDRRRRDLDRHRLGRHRVGRNRAGRPPALPAGGRHGAGGSAARRGVHRRRRRARSTPRRRPRSRARPTGSTWTWPRWIRPAATACGTTC